MLPYFHQYKKSNIDALIRLRKGETKLGELIAIPGEGALNFFLEKTLATFIVLGIAEDIGVLANYGHPGTDTAWNSFLNSFLNVQANEFTRPEAIAVIGHFSFDELKHEIERKSIPIEEKIAAYGNIVPTIDKAVAELIALIVAQGKVPVVVGGGHNNAYPIIKGTATALTFRDPVYSKGINCVNLDAHLDYRVSEGRHSGNGFRYAKQESLLQKYFVLSIHQNYIQDFILRELKLVEDIQFITYEDIFIRRKKSWLNALEDAVRFVGHDHGTGIELDLDSIENFPASAISPCGITFREALQYVDHMAAHCKVAYLHICEGIATQDHGRVGKAISYIVSQFVRAYGYHVI